MVSCNSYYSLWRTKKIKHGAINKLIEYIQDTFNKVEGNTLDNDFYKITNVYGIKIMLKGGGNS